MTRREFIETKFPYPISDMVIKNTKAEVMGNYLDGDVREDAKASYMLGALFTWCSSPEGHEFWESLRNKLQEKNL
jgi:hypothetical protein